MQSDYAYTDKKEPESIMRKSRKLKIKLSQALYHNSCLQKSAVELKKSLDEVSDILCKKMKVKKK